MSLFSHVPAAPPDAIYHLTTACNADPNPQKLNLGVGVYKDASGNIPILQTVKKAERQIFEEEKSKSYLPIEGSVEFGLQTRRLLLGCHNRLAESPSSVTLQTPGGTGALRLAFELIAQQLPSTTIWISNPTWSNHGQLCTQAGSAFRTYPYYSPVSKSLDTDTFLEALRQIPVGDVILLHGCCHNPTGNDLDLDTWHEVSIIAKERGILPVIDIAYQGFARGLDQDAEGLRLLADSGLPLMVCNSFSKNFGLYKERVGSLTVLGFETEESQRLLSQLKVMARTLWSSPPSHGSQIVTRILEQPELRTMWVEELREMRERINEMRHLLAESMQDLDADTDFSFMSRQFGLFSLTGIAPEVNEVMRQRDGIYFMSTGRINVAGLTSEAIAYFCQSFLAAIT